MVPRTFCAVISLAAYVASSPIADAASVKFRAELSGPNVVPANERSARGYLTATYDTQTKRLTWSATYSGLSSKVTGIHFHAPARPNQTAGVVQKIEILSEGSATLSDAEARDLVGGFWYVDVHTRSHRQGEIRGQVMRGE